MVCTAKIASSNEFHEVHMILPDHRIIAWAKAGGLVPFDKTNINPASVDLRVDGVWRDFDNHKLFSADMVILYPRTFLVDLYNFFAKIFKLKKKMTIVYAVTMERVNLHNGLAGMVKLKSSRIREGLGYPIADWVDPGYRGKLTLMLTAHRKIKICAGQRIVQLVVEEMEMSDKPYDVVGHYMDQTVPTGSWRNGYE